MRLIKAICKCGCIFIADSNRWHMDYCPKCKSSAIDLEKYYCRLIGDVKIIEEFNAPYFEDSNDYHSALLSWVNDSDKEYTLYINKDILWIVEE